MSPVDNADSSDVRDDAALLRASFARAQNQVVQLSQHFYARLFELAPQLRALFSADLTAQSEKFAQTLRTLIEFVGRPAELLPGLRQLGARHRRYGVQPAHFALVGAALISALNQPSPGLSAPERRAWAQFYSWITAQMLIGLCAGAASLVAVDDAMRDQSQ